MKTFTPVSINQRKELDMRSGDTVRVWQKIQDKDKTRLQAFEGMVLARKHGTEPGATFTVRRNTNGYGVEKIFPLYSPMIDKIEIVKRSKVRRSKLYYVREQALKTMRKRLKMMFVDYSTTDIEDETKEKEVEETEEVENTEVESSDTEETQEEVVEENKETEEVKEEVEEPVEEKEEEKKEDK